MWHSEVCGSWFPLLFVCFHFSLTGTVPFLLAIWFGVPFSFRQLFAFIEIAKIADSALSWSQEPKQPTEAVEGENATLRWDYDLGGATFLLVKWHQILDGNEKEIAKRILSNNLQLFGNFTARFNVTDKATLIITNVLRTDTGKYECTVTPQSGADITSTRQLNVLCK